MNILKYFIKELEEFDKDMDQDVVDALNHWCTICKRSFKTKAAKSTHVTIKHKHHEDRTTD